MVHKSSDGVWGRLQTYLTRGLRLLDAAQAESLGGRSPTTAPQLSGRATAPEGSPDYPGNWTSPYEVLFAPTQPWACDDWAVQITAQTTMVGQHRCNRELFGMLAPHRAAMMVSALGEAPDWRQLSVAVEAGLRGLAGDSPDTLPCHLGHEPGAAQAREASCKAPGLLQWAMQQSNRALLSWGMERRGRHGLCAGAMLHFCCDRAWFVQLGGLRLYRWREGSLELLTASDAEPQPLPHPTQPARVGSRGTRFLGFRELPRLPVSSVTLETGDILVLSSPGLHDAVSHHAIEQTIGEHPDAIETACHRLIDVAWNTRPQPSDISLLLARVTDDLRARKRREAARWRAQFERGLF